MDKQLDKILNFVRRSGDKVIVLKDDSEFVVSSLDDYSRLVEGNNPISQLSESQMLDKINHDIALWRESQKEFQSQDRELDFLAEPESPRYVSSDLSTQDTLDKLSDDILLGNQEDTQEPAEPAKDFEWQPDSELEALDKEKKDEFDKPELDDFGQPDSLDLEDIDFDDDFGDFGQDSDLDLSAEEDNQPALDLEREAEVDSPRAQVKINNFGYPNPVDTSNNQKEELDSWLELDQEQLNENQDNFDNIPPPPDI